jgi:hypothetical protein
MSVGDEHSLKRSHLHLNCFAKIIASTLPLDDLLVDLAGRNVVVSGKGGKKVALIISDI